MAEHAWEDHTGGSDFVLAERRLVRRKTGHIIRCPIDGSYRAVVYPYLHTPGGNKECLLITQMHTEAEAKKAVEEYWADKDLLPLGVI